MRSASVRATFPGLLSLLALTAFAGCKSDNAPAPQVPVDAGAAPDGGGPTKLGPGPYADLPLDALNGTVESADLSAPVDLVRDDSGIPHIFAENVPDAAFAQGYIMAQDRWMEMDFVRRQASGTLAEMAGGLSTTLVEADIRIRAHHLRATAEEGYKKILASQDPTDRMLVSTLKKFTAGVNAWQAHLRAGIYKLPPEVSVFYTLPSVAPWSELDSVVLGEYQAYSLAFDAGSDIARTRAYEQEAAVFVGAADPAKLARVGFVDDYYRAAAWDPAHTVDGWKEAAGLASRGGATPRGGSRGKRDAAALALLDAAFRGVDGLGLDPRRDPSRGSNNWVVAPSLSTNGQAMIANDTHLQLTNPAIFYLVHITTRDGFDAMGVQFPGIPLVTLGMNRNVAWGGTVNFIDVTDVYAEQVVTCTADAASKCVKFKGAEVKLTLREEAIKVGFHGNISDTVKAKIWDVPHHGPIIPRTNPQGTEPLGAQELSVKYTGHVTAPLLRAVYGVNVAKDVDEATASIERDFGYGGQNWVFADVKGNIAWTQATRIPKRPKGAKPWLVLPGDGSAEWLGFFDVKYAPHAKNPAKGYLVTANADPLGVNDKNDPAANPEVEGSPLYLGTEYDPGTRASRITKRIVEASAKKLDRDAMSSIQGDAISEWGRALAPAFVEGATDLLAEIATPGSKPALTPLLAAAKPGVKGFVGGARDLVQTWTFDTPAGTDPGATPAEIAASKAAALMAVWTTRLAKLTLDDETTALGIAPSQKWSLKLLANVVNKPADLRTKDAVFDDLGTPVLETRSFILAKAVLAAIDFLMDPKVLGPDPTTWRWGSLHTVAPRFYLPSITELEQPRFARHGGDGTVDVANHGVDDDDYSYGSGPSIRFVASMDPKGPVARNVLPGGEIFDTKSPHYNDLYKLWVKNQTVELAFNAADVVERAKKEIATNKLGRRRFTPPNP
jgi:penicillin amidase